ncbi:class I SAM-dependent methyltransferase [Oleiagrimonas soli]|uniref:SAM-dependent methyltransferase n=1 Tax=Oleiagrimonas soli TaxID=1543381 RepID=A0A841KNJ3_9GAMM|nr:class I SAM-dependent methyltransferase [Oleiagrimonas soli]MBB6184221.1 SAM-dependent methyltransferase [Oleiagrimonas soli]
MDIESIGSNLQRDRHGIFVTKHKKDVSYPENGHATCFQIENDSFWFNHRNTCIEHVIQNHPFEGALLDIGGGNGFVSAMLQARGYEVVLLEPGYEGAFNARTKRGVNHVLCATLEECGFAPSSFGAIGLFDVIEHIREDREFLRSLKPVLKPSGMLYLTVPCHAWLWSQSDIDAGHFRRHTSVTMRRLLEPDFDIEYLSYFFAPLVIPQLAFRALPYRVGAGRHKNAENARAHGTRKGLTTRTISRLLRVEATKIARNRSLRFGSSCLVAARLR